MPRRVAPTALLTGTLVALALAGAACTVDDGSPGGSSSGSAGSGGVTRASDTSPTGSSPGATSSVARAGVLRVVTVYRPVCGPEPRPAPSTPSTPALPPCPEEAVAGVQVSALRADGSVAARGVTAADGGVDLPLPPGDYSLVAAAAPSPRVTPRPTAVTVGTEPMPTVTLVYESSMQ